MIEAIFLGLLQGLTEFLPISSSAHIRIAGEFLPSGSDPGATFTAIIQIGTELAVLLYFRHMLWGILKSISKKFSRAQLNSEEETLFQISLLIFWASIPIGIFGFLFQETIREGARTLSLTASVLILFGIALWASDRFRPSDKNLRSLTFMQGFFLGLAQALALIPGVSRSGATITAGRMMGFDRSSSLTFAFLLAIPAVFASGFYELITAARIPDSLNYFSPWETAMATLVSFIVGYLVIAWLMKFISRSSFAPFVLYRIGLGVAILMALNLGII
jgi:undecaprenyl-diphosphatase